MLIFTDAGYKKGISSHGFVVRSWDGREILRKSFLSNDDDSNKSEMTSIISALNWVAAKRNGTKRQPRIYTDSLVIYEAVNSIGEHSIDVSYLKHMLKQLDVKLFWRKRKNTFIKQAHDLANVEMKSKFNVFKNEKIKYKCEGSQRFKVGNKKKNKYKNK